MKSKRTNTDDPNYIPSKQEMLRMPPEDYMNDVQKRYFRKVLSELEANLLQNAKGTSEAMRDLDNNVVPDPADRASLEEEYELELRTRERELQLLKKVQHALVRLAQNDYGWCEDSGEPIGVARLIARPTATLSIESQQRRELKQKLFGD